MLADFLHLISDFLYTILRCALGFCGAGGWAGGAGERFLTVRRQKKSPARASQRGPEGFLSCMFSFYAYVEDLFRFLFDFHDEFLHLIAGFLCLLM